MLCKVFSFLRVSLPWSTRLRFAETFEDATWFPVAAFIMHVGGPALDTQQQQVQWVQQVCAQEIRWISGKPGVLLLDHDDGRKRMRVGNKVSTEKVQDSCNPHVKHSVVYLVS